MEEQLMARRQKAEDSFNSIQTLLNSIKAELQKYGLETVEEGYAELNRIQGEFRLLNEQINNLPKETVSKKATVIDATKVKGA
jgi:hypothetical protein